MLQLPVLTVAPTSFERALSVILAEVEVKNSCKMEYVIRGGTTVLKVGGYNFASERKIFDPPLFVYLGVQETEQCIVCITSIMAYICLSAANEVT